MMIQFVCSAIALQWIAPSLKPPSNPSFKDVFFRILPCSFSTALDIGLSNSSLKSITLSFYTMLKSSSPVFILLFAFAFRLETPTPSLILIMLIICSGVFLMVMVSEWSALFEKTKEGAQKV